MVIEPGNSLNSHNASTAKARQPSPSKSPNVEPNAESTQQKNSDSVSLSTTSQSIARLEARLANSVDVDANKVSEIKAAVDEGRYKIDPEAIASKLYQDESLLS